MSKKIVNQEQMRKGVKAVVGQRSIKSLQHPATMNISGTDTGRVRPSVQSALERPKTEKQQYDDMSSEEDQWKAQIAEHTEALKLRYRDVLAASRNVIEPIFEQLTSVIFGAMHADGRWDGEQDNSAAKIARIHSEVSQALQYFPSGNLMDGGAEGLSQELADIVIQVLDLAGRHNVDLGAAIVERMNYNLCLPTPKRAPGMPF